MMIVGRIDSRRVSDTGTIRYDGGTLSHPALLDYCGQPVDLRMEVDGRLMMSALGGLWTPLLGPLVVGEVVEVRGRGERPRGARPIARIERAGNRRLRIYLQDWPTPYTVGQILRIQADQQQVTA